MWVGVFPQWQQVSGHHPRVSQSWTQKSASKVPIPTDFTGQQEKQLGRSLHQLRASVLAGCIRHTHRCRHHLLLCSICMKARPSSPQVHSLTRPTTTPLTSHISHHARNQQLRHPLARKPTSQGTQHPNNPLAQEHHTTLSSWLPELSSSTLGVLTFMPLMSLAP